MALPQFAAQTMMEAYREVRPRSLFLTSLARTIPGSTGGTGDAVTWDVERKTNRMAGTIDKCSGTNMNTIGQFTTKQLEPPTYDESHSVNVCDLVNRMVGEDPWSAGNTPYRARFIDRMSLGLSEASAMIDVSMEEQVAQVMQTGQLSLLGAKPFAADFLPKSAHFATVGTLWSDAVNCTPLTDIEDRAYLVQLNGRKKVTKAIFGRTAWKEFMDSDQVKEVTNLLRADLIAVDPNISERGATFMGTATVGTYQIQMWRYDGTREPYPTGTEVPFVDDDNVILLPDDPRIIIASLEVPRVLPMDPRLAGLVPNRTKSEAGWDLTPNAFASPDGKVIYAGMSTRAVIIPQAIDAIACLGT